MRCCLSALPLALCLVACGSGTDQAAADAALIAQDPVIARALDDLLMNDPDLASRNEANAAFGFVDSNALPVLKGDSGAAREAMRIELLEGGPLPELRVAGDTPGGAPLGPMSGPGELLAAVGALDRCAAALKEDFAIAADLPAAATLPPRAMVVQAGGADGAGCGLRVVRYLSAAPAEDVLLYHAVRASRMGLETRRFVEPSASLVASGTGAERVAVHVRQAAHALTGVTLVYRSN
jgi:hypothetical protein